MNNKDRWYDVCKTWQNCIISYFLKVLLKVLTNDHLSCLSSYEQISVLKSLQQLETFPDFELDSHPSQQRSGGRQRIDISKADIYWNYSSAKRVS